MKLTILLLIVITLSIQQSVQWDELWDMMEQLAQMKSDVIDIYLEQLVRHRLLMTPTCAWEAITGLNDQKGEGKLPLSMKNFSSNMFLPDVYAVYWHQLYHLEDGQYMVLKGKVPHSRYYSFITYGVQGEELGHINGTNIISDSNGNFELLISNFPVGNYSNWINATSSYLGVQAGVILYRLYLPLQNSLGAVQLPEWLILNKNNSTVREVYECDPINSITYIRDKLTQGYALVKAGKIFNKTTAMCQSEVPRNVFVYPNQSAVVNSFFGNPDNFYIEACMTPLDQFSKYGKDIVVLVTGKAPKLFKDVLYWSLNQNNWKYFRPLVDGCAQLTVYEQTSWQLPPGQNCWVDENQRYAIVLSPERPEMPPSNIPFSWVNWGKYNLQYPVLALRQMNPSQSFSASLQKYKGAQNDPVALQQYMGDYYPQIKYCTLQSFQSKGIDCVALKP